MTPEQKNEVKEILNTLIKEIENGIFQIKTVHTSKGIREVPPEEFPPEACWRKYEPDGSVTITINGFRNPIDKSQEADAERFRWLLDGNGYFMDEEDLWCGHDPVSEKEKDKARKKIDDYRFGRGEWG
jgi:hypothetical protein